MNKQIIVEAITNVSHNPPPKKNGFLLPINPHLSIISTQRGVPPYGLMIV